MHSGWDQYTVVFSCCSLIWSGMPSSFVVAKISKQMHMSCSVTTGCLLWYRSHERLTLTQSHFCPVALSLRTTPQAKAAASQHSSG